MTKHVFIKQVARTLIVSLLTSLVAFLVHAAVNNDLSLPKYMGGASKYEATAQSCIESPGDEGIDAIGGLDDIKRDLDTLRRALRAPNVFFDPDVPSITPPARLLFAGLPGTGKTMLAKALAVDVEAVFINVTMSTLEDKYFGETPKILKAIFQLATERANTKPVILFFDEIDGIMRKRREDDQSHVYGMKTEFLQHLDTLKGSVVVIGCTNCAESLDPALKRRLPDVYRFPLPDEAERLDILRRLARKEKKVKPSILRAVAKECVACSGSDLKQRYKRACLSRYKRVMDTVQVDASTTAHDVYKAMPQLTLGDWTTTTQVKA